MILPFRLGVLTVMGLLAPVTLVACGSGPQEITLNFQARSVERGTVDLGTQGSSRGDRVAGNGDLLNDQGEVIGHFDVVSVVDRVTTDSDGRFLQAEYSFGPQGADSFVILGAEKFALNGGLPVIDRPANYAVVGGTGVYRGANGQCDVHRNNDPKKFTTSVSCTFTVMS